MKLAAAALAAFSLAAALPAVVPADEKLLFVYVSPNPIGVNDFLKLGKIGTERIAKALGAQSNL